MPPGIADEIVAAGLGAGLVAVGIIDTQPFHRERRALERRRDAGHHGGMAFTYRNPRRSADPTSALPSARSVVVGAWSYAGPPAVRPLEGTHARVARYAWADHYADLRAALAACADVLRAHGHRAVVVADDNAMIDRAAANRAGIGWWGRNTNLLHPTHGGWVVLGNVVTDADLPLRAEPVGDLCRSCTRCIPACPTGALDASGVLDARRCLAWTVQTTGMLPRAQRIALGDRIYGCDDCLDVCPPGRRASADTSVTLTSRATAAPTHEGPWVDLHRLLTLDDDALLAEFGRWYIPARDPAHLRRNAVVVLGNIGDPDDERDVATLRTALADADGLVRAHAVWAAARMGRRDLLDSLADDPDVRVRSELAIAPAVPINRTRPVVG